MEPKKEIGTKVQRRDSRRGTSKELRKDEVRKGM
jgi:hypothetical protein